MTSAPATPRLPTSSSSPSTCSRSTARSSLSSPRAARGRSSCTPSCSSAKPSSIETTAEGIERPQDLSLIKSEECDNGQGFLFTRPLSAQDADAFFRQWPETRRFEVRHEANALAAAKKIEPPEPVLALEPKSTGKD